MEGILQWIADFIKAIEWWAVVNPWEQGVRVRFGKNASILAPGWHLRIPIVDRVWIINSRLRFTSFPCQTITTTDGKTVTVAGLVGFKITDPLSAMQSLMQPEISVAAIVQTTVAEYVWARAVDELDRNELEQAALDDLNHVTAGIEFDFVRMTDFAVVKTYRLLQETYRPETRHDKEPGDRE